MNRRMLAIVLGGALSACIVPNPKPIPVPPPPATYAVVVSAFEGDPALDNKVAQAEFRVLGAAPDDRLFGVGVTDGAGNGIASGLKSGSYRVCVKAVDFKESCLDDITLPGAFQLNITLTRDISPIAALGTSGPVFTENGAPWRYKGVSAFGLLNRFAHGEDIDPFLVAFKGFNVLRVWPYVTWPGTGWESPSPDTVIAFCRHVAQFGFRVELTLLTDDDAARIGQAKQLVEALKAARPPNVMLEAGNEPTTHKAIDTAALRDTLQGSGFPYSSGDYEDSKRFYGSYLTAHTGRDGDWPRRAHDLLDYYIGGGPNDPSDPAHKVPIIADEPAKPGDVGGDRDSDFVSYFAACSLLGGGATFHFENGKFGNVPTAEEAHYAALALEGLDAFPPQAPQGGYRRIDENGGSLRTYAVGLYMVRVRPTTGAAPEPGWVSLDSRGIRWKR